MYTNIQKTKQEKIKELIDFKFKADKDIILYYHFKTIYNELKNEIKEESLK